MRDCSLWLLTAALLLLPTSVALAADTTIQLGTGDDFVVQDSGATPRLIVDETTGKVVIGDVEISEGVIGGAPNRGDIWYDNGTTITRLPPGTSGQFLQTQGSEADPIWEFGPARREVFTASGTFTAPTGVTLVYLTMVGGGGGGSTGGSDVAGGGGGGGGMVILQPYTVIPDNNYSVTIGAGGGTGSDGGSSSFDSSAVAPGGMGAVLYDPSPTQGGGGFDATDGNGAGLSLKGGNGKEGAFDSSGGGGGSLFGIGGNGGFDSVPGTNAAANSGAGGGGGGASFALGGSGGSGLAIVSW